MAFTKGRDSLASRFDLNEKQQACQRRRLLLRRLKQGSSLRMSTSQRAQADRKKDTNPRVIATDQAQPSTNTADAPAGGPRHYHLLWDEELEALRPVLRLVSERLGEVIEHWYRLYVLHFGAQRSLSEPKFRDLFYNALSRNTKDLLDGDMDRYAID